MTVKEIVMDWLKSNKYDGLYIPGECGCLIDDLAPCSAECFIHCLAGIKMKNTRSEFDFMVGPKKIKSNTIKESK